MAKISWPVFPLAAWFLPAPSSVFPPLFHIIWRNQSHAPVPFTLSGLFATILIPDVLFTMCDNSLAAVQPQQVQFWHAWRDIHLRSTWLSPYYLEEFFLPVSARARMAVGCNFELFYFLYTQRRSPCVPCPWMFSHSFLFWGSASRLKCMLFQVTNRSQTSICSPALLPR